MNGVLEQWLLNLAIDFPVEVRLLPAVLDGDDREPHALNVRALRGFSLEDGAHRLVELAEHGVVELIREIERGEPRVVAPSEILPLMARHDIPKELSFRLTAAGGRAWEAAAQPRWHEMHDGFATAREQRGELVGFDWTCFSQNRERLMAMLGWWPMLEQEHVNLDTVAWKLAEDYEVKYWKRLPSVHVVTFQSLSGKPSTVAWRRGAEPRWFQEWRIGSSAWYRPPWEMEGWPPKPDR